MADRSTAAAASSPGSGDSTSALSARESERAGRSSAIPSAAKSSPDTSPTLSDSRMSGGSEPTTSPRSRSSAEASPVKTSPSPARGPGSTVSARVFGPSSQGLLASFDPDTSSWRTSQLSLEVSGLAEFSETWPRAGMTRSGIAYLLRPLAPLTGGIGSGLLPTPRATYGDRGGRGDLLAQVRTGKGSRRREWPTPKASHSGPDFARAERLTSGGDDLPTAVAREEEVAAFWPTPHGMPKRGQHRRPGPSGNELGRAVNERERLPTPTVGDSRSARNATANRHDPNSKHHSGTTLTDAVVPKTGGGLNPTWVEWLMGFPLGWTDLAPSETPSFHRSRSGSDDASLSSTKGSS